VPPSLTIAPAAQLWLAEKTASIRIKERIDGVAGAKRSL
jgi:hypothetical protein